MSGREQTLILVKPDGVQRALVGEIISRFEKKGLQMVALKLLRVSPELAAKHYQEHLGKGFYNDLVSFITSSPVAAMVWEGSGAVSLARRLIGETDPQKAAPGTIRGDLAMITQNNLVHGSDSPKSARREIALFFCEDEILSYQMHVESWIYGG